MDDVTVQRTNKIKFLGIIYDEHLTFKYHVDYLRAKISKWIGILHKLEHFLPTYILSKLYNSFIHSFIDYGIEIWHSAFKNDIDKMIVL